MIGAVLAARVDLREHAVKPLFWYARRRSVIWRPEPNQGQFEAFLMPSEVIAVGIGDCDDLVIWRCAELQNAGELALPLVYWRPDRPGMHAQVRRSNRTVEDPSRLMGM